MQIKMPFSPPSSPSSSHYSTLLTSQVSPCPNSLGLLWKHCFLTTTTTTNLHSSPHTQRIHVALKQFFLHTEMQRRQKERRRRKKPTYIEHAQRVEPEPWRLRYLHISRRWHILMWCVRAKMDKFSDKNVIKHIKVSRTASNTKYSISHTIRCLRCTVENQR